MKHQHPRHAAFARSFLDLFGAVVCADDLNTAAAEPQAEDAQSLARGVAEL